MSHRNGLPRKNASNRTIKRWLDPDNRTILDIEGKEWIPSANPSCTAGRNNKRFNDRPRRLAERTVLG